MIEYLTPRITRVMYSVRYMRGRISRVTFAHKKNMQITQDNQHNS